MDTAMAKSADAWGGGGHIFTAMHESISILAKCEALDLPVPSLLRKALHRINHAAEQKVEQALDIIDKPEPKKEDGAFRKF